MSIAGKEARGEYWNEIDLQAVMLRTAYVAGRTAEPCEEQVEAVAQVLRDTFAWNHVEAPERVEDYHGFAREILDAARKVVSE